MTQGLERPPHTIFRPEILVCLEVYFPLLVYLSNHFFFAFTKENMATNIPVLASHSDAFPVGRDKNKIPKKFLVVII